MKKYLLIFLLLTAIPFQSMAVDMETWENKIISALLEVRKQKTYEAMFEKNNVVKQEIRKMMQYDEAFKYDFDSLGQYMGTLVAPDNGFRLFNWNFEKPNGDHMYFGLVMKYDKRRERYQITELFDKSGSLENAEPEKKALDNKRWFGALYYKIIPFKKGGRQYYTLLGWDGNNRLSNKKIIEVMAFSGSKIKFGFPLFRQEDKQWFRRVIFEYSANATMSLKEYKMKKETAIVFDHLSPASGALEGHRSQYYPDGSFDSYVLEDGKWYFRKDPDARAEKSIKDRYYNQPKEVRPKE